ncbi:hypothetical protein [Hydrogenophaga defluvii]|uniref:Uncharacterized protein n=1 Tax=Hydrogenophaga defluvii TaxID=249410 RepID=A0ABW2SGA9_9BURK
MKWLDRLKTPKAPDPHATKPTKPQESKQAAGFVGFVAYPPAPFQKIEASTAAANDATDTTPTTDPDRWCWPHSEAMNGQEIDTFTARLSRFTDKGLTLTDAEREADRLAIRDRENDNRRLCLECAHLHGAGRWRCGNWHRAEVANQLKDAHLPGALVLTLQRCPGFGATTP